MKSVQISKCLHGAIALCSAPRAHSPAPHPVMAGLAVAGLLGISYQIKTGA